MQSLQKGLEYIGKKIKTGRLRSKLRRPKEEEKMKKTGIFRIFWLLAVTVFALAFFVGVAVLTAPAEAASRPIVVFTFDDGRLDGAPLALPIMAKYKFRGTCYIVSGFVGQDWVMSADQLKDLQSKGWEIGGHGKSHKSLLGLTEAELIDELQGAKNDLEALGLTNVRSFASPFGDYDERAISYVSRYYESHRTAWPSVGNPWPYNNYLIMVREVTNLTTPEEVKAWLDEAGQDEIIVLLFHALVPGVPEAYQCNVDTFKKVVDIVRKKRARVVTMTEALQITSAPNLVVNPSFSEVGTDGWATGWDRSLGASVDTASKGNFPEPTNSLKVVGGVEPEGAWTLDLIPVKRAWYMIKVYQRVESWGAGGVGMLVDEFDKWGNYLNTQWLGGDWQNFIGTRQYEYYPSRGVKFVSLVPFTEEASKLVLFLDSIEFRKY